MLVVGLTGSIGMGKSTTAAMFAELGIPVHDADKTVHDLYGKGGDAVEPVRALFPAAVIDDAVDRSVLSGLVVGNPVKMAQLESIVHPLVRNAENTAITEAKDAGHAFAILDIPLLFETGGETRCDAVIVVTAPETVQRDRVLSRPGMTEAKFAAILAKQVPDAEKRSRADYIVDTSKGLDDARAQVRDIAAKLTALAAAHKPGD